MLTYPSDSNCAYIVNYSNLITHSNISVQYATNLNLPGVPRVITVLKLLHSLINTLKLTTMSTSYYRIINRWANDQTLTPKISVLLSLFVP